jgi:hypothetical protein
LVPFWAQGVIWKGPAARSLWCAQRSAVEKILPGGMVAPGHRTPEQLQDILES